MYVKAKYMIDVFLLKGTDRHDDDACRHLSRSSRSLYSLIYSPVDQGLPAYLLDVKLILALRISTHALS